jgi:hypothetical protein
MEKYFIVTRQKTLLPFWFRTGTGKKSISIISTQVSPKVDIQVCSNLAIMNTEFGDRNNGFVCYANVLRDTKTFDLSGQFDFVEFWFEDENDEKINNNKFTIELLLNLQK